MTAAKPPSTDPSVPLSGSATTAPVAVLGAGLTGMSAACHLRRNGVKTRIFERADRVGGLAVTNEERGYRFDKTGHLLHVRDEDIRRLALGWIGPRYSVIQRQSAIWSHGTYTRYPFQANTHGLPPDVAYACVMGFLEAQRSAPGPIHNFEDYCRAHFGDGISEHFMIPYNTRVWGVPPTEISAAWCERFVPRPAIEDVIAGAVGHRRGELGYNRSFIYPHDGIGALAEGMGRELGDVELGRAPRKIVGDAKQLVFDDEKVSYGALVSSIPLDRLVALIEDAPEAVRAAAKRLRITPLHYLDVALRWPAQKPYHWIYVPEAKYPFYRVGCYAHFSKHMAPPGKSSLYVELVDRGEPDVGRLLPEVAAALMEMGIIRSSDAIVFARARHIEHAYVIFDRAYDEALEVIKPYLASVGIISTGRYGGWNYSSMGDALAFGRDAAAEIMERAESG